jgi:imidazole glycerol-phosphate synthase subunit HisF
MSLQKLQSWEFRPAQCEIVRLRVSLDQSGRNSLNIRIIPKLDIKGPNLVKGIHFEGLRVLGKPEDFARYYYENGADELFYMDAVASLYGRNSLLDIVEKASREIFIPLTVGGGLRSVDDIRTVLRAGADKISINTAAVGRPELIREASRAFGSSTIVVSIEAIRKPDGTYEAYIDYGRQKTGLDAFEWAIKAVELGAGELVVTSINNEGTGKGFDLELTRRIAESVPVPVIASGGAGGLDHIGEVIRDGKADAVSIASIIHYNFIKERPYESEDFKSEGNIEFLRKGKQSSRIKGVTLSEIKDYLASCGIGCRQIQPEAAHA